jgi:DNA-binding CsgD family transcriptional regulator
MGDNLINLAHQPGLSTWTDATIALTAAVRTRRWVWRPSPSAPDAELPATGETVRKRPVETVMELTAQEAHIARLAVEAHTNSAIGAQLFISARTVEWHLRKVFTKLAIGHVGSCAARSRNSVSSISSPDRRVCWRSTCSSCG